MKIKLKEESKLVKAKEKQLKMEQIEKKKIDSSTKGTKSEQKVSPEENTAIKMLKKRPAKSPIE